MDKEKVTIEDLAAMVQRGFADTKRDMASGFAAVSQRLDAVEDRLDSIEKLLLEDHRRRIERLEGQVKELRDLLVVK